MAETKMLIGLGNPDAEYANTRHNIGFMVIDLLAGSLKIEINKRKFGGRFGSGDFAGKKVFLLKPQLFMNRSGEVVTAASLFYKLKPADLLVITDDMWLEPGKIRIRASGSSGGHNGLADIIERLGTDDFPRLRVGIGQSDKSDSVDYVLGAPDKNQLPLIEKSIETARDAAMCWLEFGIEKAMNSFNAPL
jgi:PTH1 family peptidyl-tRNA hydrolase